MVPGKVPADVFVRNMDSSGGERGRQLSSRLEDKCMALAAYVASWPTTGGSAPMQRESSWGDVTQPPKDCDDCPIVCTLVEVIIATPHGSVENERAFSDMNLIMTTLRIHLDHGHLKDAARLCNQRNSILQPVALA